MSRQLVLGLRKRVTLFVVVFPDQPVVPQVTQALETESRCCNNTQDAGYQPSTRKRLDGVDESCAACRWDAEEDVYRERQMESGKDEVDIEEQRVFLHHSVVDRSVPKQEAGDRNHWQVNDTRNHILASVTRALDEQKDTRNHVDDQCQNEEQPQLVEILHDGLAVRWDLGFDIVVDERVEEGPVVSTMFLDVGGTVVEIAFATGEFLFSSSKLFHSVGFGSGGRHVIGSGGFVGGGCIVVAARVHAGGIVECTLDGRVGERVGIQRIAVGEGVGGWRHLDCAIGG